MNSSDNYRGISLSNSILIGFKNNHSTVLCTAVYIETVNHYMNEGSDVYRCLIGASKAFDRVHGGNLFLH